MNLPFGFHSPRPPGKIKEKENTAMKRKTMILLLTAGIALAGLTGCGTSTGSGSAAESASPAGGPELSSNVIPEEESSAAESQADGESAPQEEDAAADDIPTEYKNALKKAETYSGVMHMSKQRIYDQLVSEYGENFPAEAAQYAIENLQADFKANALEKAKSYYETMNMSKEAVREQLVSEYGEQFTQEEADYAIEHLE